MLSKCLRLVLLIISSFDICALDIIAKKNQGLVDLKSINPNIIIDLKYATSNNFTKQKVYNFNKCLVLYHVALELDAIQKYLDKLGLRLKIWDGYRPLLAQEKFWEILPDERYVTNPKNGGGRHTRGTTVDVTLVDKSGKELTMPTAFDDFSECAHRDYKQASREAMMNRDILRNVMEKHGFTGIVAEWWHFDCLDWRKYPVLKFDVNSYIT